MSHAALLRASGAVSGQTLDTHVVTDGSSVPSGVDHQEVLIAFTEAIVGDDERVIATTRQRILAELGPEVLVDAAAVASNFEQMVRIADATGIPVDDFIYEKAADLRVQLNLDRFESAANTPKT